MCGSSLNEVLLTAVFSAEPVGCLNTMNRPVGGIGQSCIDFVKRGV